MAKAKGRELFLYKPDGDGDFAPVCGGLSSDLTLTNEMVEEKRIPCDGPRSAQAVMDREFGSQDRQFSFQGFFDDDENGKAVALAAENQTVLEGWKVIVPGFGSYVGNWLISQFQFTGQEQGSLQFSAQIAQAAKPTFTPAA